jgi:MEDS: MEthanogen/methylotroph, DcmR Sensory domain
MTAPGSSTLLAEAPAGRHLAQFHRDRHALAESVQLFLEGGLRRGNSLVAITTPESADSILERLNESKFHPQALISSGQLAMVDAAGLMQQFLSNGTPEWARFRSVVGAILERVRPFGRGTRIYCEISSLLWRDGNTRAAIEIEEHWNTLGRTHAFSLYCGFVLDTHCEESYGGPLEDLGNTFSDILGTVEDDRFEVALDRASKEIFGIALSQMAGMTKQDGARRFPGGQRTMLWMKRNLPMSTGQLAERARRYYQEPGLRNP